MSKFSNIIKMMNLLIVNERMNRSQLAKEIGVSERMIRKYIDDFKEANIEINSFTGPKGGYEIKSKIVKIENINIKFLIILFEIKIT